MTCISLRTCSCDTNLSSFGMFTRDLGTRAGKHLNLDDSHQSAIKHYNGSVINVAMTYILLLLSKSYGSAIQIMIEKIHQALLIKYTKVSAK